MMQPATKGTSSSDIMIALAVVACLGIGASLTFVLTRGKGESAAAVAPVIVEEGKPLLQIGKGDKPDEAPALVVPEQDPNSEYLSLGFDTLSNFLYLTPSAENAAKPERKKDVQIPSPVRALNGKKVSVQGFMSPLDVDDRGKVPVFMLLKDQSMCCFGRWPRMNEWVRVTMPEGKPSDLMLDQPVTVIGTLEVGEDIEKGVVLSIYRMKAEHVTGPLDF
jgi:hypothetical protein